MAAVRFANVEAARRAIADVDFIGFAFERDGDDVRLVRVDRVGESGVERDVRGAVP